MPKLSDTNKPARHPDNNNLRLHYDDTYENLPVMVDKGPFIREYLSDLKCTIDSALSEYPRVLAFRVDLRLLQGKDLPDYACTNQVISRFSLASIAYLTVVDMAPGQLNVAICGYSPDQLTR